MVDKKHFIKYTPRTLILRYSTACTGIQNAAVTVMRAIYTSLSSDAPGTHTSTQLAISPIVSAQSRYVV